MWHVCDLCTALFKDFLMALYEDHETMDIMWRDHYIDNQLWLQVCRKLRGLIMHRPHIMFPSQEVSVCIMRVVLHHCQWHRVPDVTRHLCLTCGALGLSSVQAGLQFAAAPSMDVIMPLAVRVARTYFLAKVEGNMVLAQSADLRLPHTWYPTTRLMQRKIIYHAGPTNSGKDAFGRMGMHSRTVVCVLTDTTPQPMTHRQNVQRLETFEGSEVRRVRACL